MQVTLQPLTLGVDAAILFADILLPLEPMGASFEFAKGEGPVIHEPIASREQIDRLRVIEPEESLPYVLSAIRMLKKELKVPLIGFAGAPFTLASYLVEGGKSANFAKTKKLMYGAPDAWSALMEKLSEVVRRYLRAQIDAGVDAVQLFDSWVGDLAPADYLEHVQPHVRRMLCRRRDAPACPSSTSARARPRSSSRCATRAGRSSASTAARRSTRPGRASATTAPSRATWTRALSWRRAPWPPPTRSGSSTPPGGRPGHIFNLGHGILPETPVDNVRAVVEYVREASAR